MLKKLVDSIANAPEERFSEISLEDAALGRTWCEAQKHRGKKNETLEKVEAQLEAWLEKHQRPQWDTEGHRYQWVLRDLLDSVQEGNLAELQRDELDFLSWAYTLADRIQDRKAYARVRSLLTPYLNEIEVRRKEMPHRVRLSALSNRIGFIETTDIEEAPPTTVRTIAGIEISARGPLLKCSGHVKLLGNVPDDCTLVVENGCCSVMGYVMGRLAATHHCDVRKNISGTVISSLGSIRARNIIDQACIVAKAGNVHARRVENPKLLFAGQRLVVADSIRRGSIIAPDIDVHNEVLGGRLQISRSLKSGWLRATPDLPLDVIFRKHLTAGDFGGVPTKEASSLSSEVLRLKTRILTHEWLVTCLDREVERIAENALYFVLSNQATQKQVDAIRRDKSRLAVIDRIIQGLLGMAYAIAERAAERAAALGKRGPGNHGEVDVMFGVADAVLTELGTMASDERDVQAFISRVADIRDGIRSNVPGNRLAASSLTRIRGELRRWVEERNRLVEEVQEREKRLRAQLNFSQYMHSATEAYSPERMLKDMLASAQARPADNPFARKLAGNVVSAMCRTMQKRRQTAEERRRELRDLCAEFEHKAERLRTQHHIVITIEKADSGEGPRVSGRFEGGVVLYADMIASEQANLEENARLVVPDSGEAVKTYQRRFTSIVEVEP